MLARIDKDQRSLRPIVAATVPATSRSRRSRPRRGPPRTDQHRSLAGLQAAEPGRSRIRIGSVEETVLPYSAMASGTCSSGQFMRTRRWSSMNVVAWCTRYRSTSSRRPAGLARTRSTIGGTTFEGELDQFGPVHVEAAGPAFPLAGLQGESAAAGPRPRSPSRCRPRGRRCRRRTSPARARRRRRSAWPPPRRRRSSAASGRSDGCTSSRSRR